jgi:histidyl-tRNA synthetase
VSDIRKVDPPRAPRGTQDILPDRTPAWREIEGRMREVLHRYGYGEIRTPMFEHTELFQRGVGEATDIVQKEMYTFPDRKGRSLTLRPEGTAPVARAFVEHKLHAGPLPARLYYLGAMFRYERPQAGRYRQHHQVGAELLGSDTPAADFELVALLVDLLEAIGLGEVKVLVNSVGDGACRPAFTGSLRTYLRARESELCPDCVRRIDMNPLRVLDCKVPGCRRVVEGMPSIQDHLCDPCREHQAAVLALLDGAGLAHEIDDRLVRGLDYYTRTVFEIQHAGLGAQNALGGGGRYDRLIEDVGGPATPGVGFSTGLERLLLALEAEGHSPAAPVPPEVAVVAAGGDPERRSALLLARRLRRRFRTEVDVQGRSLGAQMRSVNKAGARAAVVVGETELAEGTFTVRDMAGGEQVRVADRDLETHLERLLAASPAGPGSGAGPGRPGSTGSEGAS